MPRSRIKYGEQVRIRLSDGAVFKINEKKPTLILDEDDLRKYYNERKRPGWITTPYYTNEFGHMTIYYWNDLNRNGRIDGSEKLHNQMIHATLDDEQAKREGREYSHALEYSHGCIHLKPSDIDKLIRYITPKQTQLTIH